MTIPKAQFAATALLIAAALSVTGCAEDFAVPEKGVYRGPEQQPLDEATRDELHGRARHQNFN